MRHRLLIIVVMAMMFCVVTSYAQQSTTPAETTTLPSPDKSLIAIVKSFRSGGGPESRVEVETRSGERLAEWSYRSGDGSHGFGVAKSQWTPDSMYFVYSLESSGGHQPWHSPVQYFSCKDKSFQSLDNALNGAVSNPEFGISAPDEVTVDLYMNKYATVSLSKLQAAR